MISMADRESPAALAAVPSCNPLPTSPAKQVSRTTDP